MTGSPNWPLWFEAGDTRRKARFGILNRTRLAPHVQNHQVVWNLIGARRRITFILLISAAALIAFAIWFKARQDSATSLAALLSRFPAAPATVVSIDFGSLRRAGLLSESKASPEPEYKQFVDGTGFNYRRDLDLVVASFSSTGNYFIARGRFDWPKLRGYAVQRGGTCYDQLCRAPGSTPERRISFLPLRSNLIALAASNDDLAAARLSKRGRPISSPIPNAPVWISIPGAALNTPGNLPEGIRVALSGLMKTDRVLVTAGPSPEGIQARMEATCRTVDNARVLESQLRSAAAILKEASRKQPSQNDSLALWLGSGSFDRNERKVNGKWSVNRTLIESLTAGI